MRQPTWTIKEQLLLQNNYYDKTDAELLQLLPGRSWSGIYSKALALGMRERYRIQRGTKNKAELKDEYFENRKIA